MPQQHKGERTYYPVRPPIQVAPLLQEMVRDSGVSSISQYLADLVAIHVGRPDLARELGKKHELDGLGLERGVLPLAM